MSASPTTSSPGETSSNNACDSTCVGLAVGLGLLFFLIGVLLMYYFKNYLMPKKQDDKGAKDGEHAPDSDAVDLEAGNGVQEGKPGDSNPAPEPNASGSLKRQRSSNNEQVIEVSAIEGNATDPTRKRHTSNNESVVDGAAVRSRRPRQSNNEDFVDAQDVPRTTSNNEQVVDPSAVKSYRRRRTSSNNERPVEMFEIQSGPPPTEADIDAARKRAASLERKLEEVSRQNGLLKETARRLQQDITELSAKNHEMQLDKT